MEENIFFDTRRLKYRGNNVIIGKTVRIRYPELVELHDNVIIDDFTYISCGLVMQEHSFIESHCTLMGGQENTIVLGKYSLICSYTSAHCKIIDLYNGLQINHNKEKLHYRWNQGIVLKDHVIIGGHSLLYPGVVAGDGARTGEFTRINQNLNEWTLYAGSPIKVLGPVDQQAVLGRLKNFTNEKPQ